jgi:hypothetical protein
LQDECESFGGNILIFLRKTLLNDMAENGAHWDLFLCRTFGAGTHTSGGER